MRRLDSAGRRKRRRPVRGVGRHGPDANRTERLEGKTGREDRDGKDAGMVAGRASKKGRFCADRELIHRCTRPNHLMIHAGGGMT